MIESVPLSPGLVNVCTPVVLVPIWWTFFREERRGLEGLNVFSLINGEIAASDIPRWTLVRYCFAGLSSVSLPVSPLSFLTRCKLSFSEILMKAGQNNGVPSASDCAVTNVKGCLSCVFFLVLMLGSGLWLSPTAHFRAPPPGL